MDYRSGAPTSHHMLETLPQTLQPLSQSLLIDEFSALVDTSGMITDE